MLTFAIRLSFLEALVGYAEAGIQTDQISVPNAPLLGSCPSAPGRSTFMVQQMFYEYPASTGHGRSGTMILSTWGCC